jgi:NAD(P)-dependent dehydrogenase (short-subunit alcohol dehydrogenase family)
MTEALFNTTLGVGLSLTKQCHDIGAEVLVADLRTTPEFDTFTRGKDDIIFVHSDVAVWSDFDKTFAACEKHFGDVPNFYGICAGLFDPLFSNFWMDLEDDGYE